MLALVAVATVSRVTAEHKSIFFVAPSSGDNCNYVLTLNGSVAMVTVVMATIIG